MRASGPQESGWESMQREPLSFPDSPRNTEVVREMDAFLDRYYELRGWDKDGAPTENKLKQLEVHQIVKYL